MIHEQHFSHTFQQKGWTKTEIQNTLRILKKAEEKKHPTLLLLENNLFWIALMKSFIANLFATIITIPLILYFEGRTLYVILAILGLSFGIILHSVAKQIENLQTKHHATVFLFFPITLIIKFRIILHISEQFAHYLQLPTPQHPILIMLAYTLPYLCPYTILLLEEKKWIA
ncbi:MAG TPA: hypothetical protein VJG90_04660 [Candidatus Nanoarchaeia archaeon]|nr:hypothetical protein [Candidatus Nanoarchaeia archaeon]